MTVSRRQKPSALSPPLRRWFHVTRQPPAVSRLRLLSRILRFNEDASAVARRATLRQMLSSFKTPGEKCCQHFRSRGAAFHVATAERRNTTRKTTGEEFEKAMPYIAGDNARDDSCRDRAAPVHGASDADNRR